MPLEILNFGDNTDWVSVNDGVMGGVSESRLSFADSGNAVFEGRVSLEKGGGFASVRFPIQPLDLSPFDRLQVRARGDGHFYQMRLRLDPASDRTDYTAGFQTHTGRWETITIPLSSFEARFRGQKVMNARPVLSARIHQVGFLVGNRQEGAFRLEIAGVYAVHWASSSAPGVELESTEE